MNGLPDKVATGGSTNGREGSHYTEPPKSSNKRNRDTRVATRNVPNIGARDCADLMLCQRAPKRIRIPESVNVGDIPIHRVSSVDDAIAAKNAGCENVIIVVNATQHPRGPHVNPELHPYPLGELPGYLPAEIWVEIFRACGDKKTDCLVSQVCQKWRWVRHDNLMGINRLIPERGHDLAIKIPDYFLLLFESALRHGMNNVVFDLAGQCRTLPKITMKRRKRALAFMHLVIAMGDKWLLKQALLLLGTPKPAYWDIQILSQLLSMPDVTSDTITRFANCIRNIKLRISRWYGDAVTIRTVAASNWFKSIGKVSMKIDWERTFEMALSEPLNMPLLHELRKTKQWSSAPYFGRRMAWRICARTQNDQLLEFLKVPVSKCTYGSVTIQHGITYDFSAYHIVMELVGSENPVDDVKAFCGRIISKTGGWLRNITTSHECYHVLMRKCVRAMDGTARLNMLYDMIDPPYDPSKVTGPYNACIAPDSFRWLWEHGYHHINSKEFWIKAILLGVQHWLVDHGAATRGTLTMHIIRDFFYDRRYNLLKKIYAEGSNVSLPDRIRCSHALSRLNSQIAIRGLQTYAIEKMEKVVEEDVDAKVLYNTWIRNYEHHDCDGTCRLRCEFCGTKTVHH